MSSHDLQQKEGDGRFFPPAMTERQVCKHDLDNQSLPESEIKRDVWNVSRLRVKHTGQETG